MYTLVMTRRCSCSAEWSVGVGSANPCLCGLLQALRGELSQTVPMRNVVQQGLFFLFEKDLPDVLEALTLLFVNDIKMVTSWA